MNAEQQQIQTAVQQGDYARAENLIQQVLQKHPNSAKAHYIHAEVLAHQNQFKQAQQEVAAAKQLDPKITFTAPEKFGKFEAYLDVAVHHPAQKTSQTQSTVVVPAQPAPAQHGIGMMSILVGVLILVMIAYFISRMFARRPTVITTAPGYPAGGAQGYANGPTYGNGPGYGGGNGGTTIINNTTGGGYGSGVGSTVAAGLGGVAAGMMLERALDERREGEGYREAPLHEQAAYQQPVDDSESNYAEQQLEQQPIDMGNDDNSWDDGSAAGGGDSWDDSSAGGSDDSNNSW
ncbi:tetratricopeptide repeat protein [Paludibacterium purpuratum]|uniref:Tetratricopeptide repeat protein n=1 Tax=Paludibacterium purpuratum TaxID=1144873 RepID=A0A4R7B4X9_9NEIS|nr:tetratricopeptide repeat protein [Paludibacterium purpuratum]TDR79710.1 tetratricopeptide repeat protein [Paludibacterium purpuratum]